MSKRITITLTDDEYIRLVRLTAGCEMPLATVAAEMLVNSVDAAFNLLDMVYGQPVDDSEQFSNVHYLRAADPLGSA